MAILEVAILLFIVFSLVYLNVAPWIWTLALTLSLITLTFVGHLGDVTLSLCWILLALAALFSTCSALRIRFFTTHLMHRIKKNMPAISKTEREAISAGDVWFEKDLFCGRPRWKDILNLPAPTLTTEEQSFLDNQVDQLCELINDWEVLQKHDLSPAAWDFLKKERFFSLVMPKEYGGKGFSAYAVSTIVTKLATHSGTAAVTTMVPNSLGPAELLLHYGTDAQKAHYLPGLGSCEEIPCFALTGAESGSDAGAMKDIGIVCKKLVDGKEVLGIELNWDKRYITLAPVSTLIGVAFYLYDPDNFLGKGQDVGITVCLVPHTQPGVERGTRHNPLNVAFMNGPTRGKDVFISVDNIIGGQDMAGQGWRMLMECLSIGRGISLPALSTAFGKLIYRMTGAYAVTRKQFNTALANFEGIEDLLAEIAGLTYTLESCRTMSAGAVDFKIRPAIISAITKYHTTEIARVITNHAMDIHAGAAVQMGPRNKMAPAHMATPVSITVEGANILTRNLIIFGQGAIRCHPYVLQEVETLSAPETPETIKQFDKLLLSHIGYFLSNLVKTFWHGLTGGLLFCAPERSQASPYYRQLSRMSVALALFADTSMMILGGDLKRKERLSARLGDVLSQLYLATSVLKYFHDHNNPESDVDYMKWSVQNCLYQIQLAFDELAQNFPQKFVGKLLHNIIFPWGRAYAKPSDYQGKKLMHAMLKPSELRERLSVNCYISKDHKDSLRRLEDAFEQRLNVEPIQKKFAAAVRSGQLGRRGSLHDQSEIALKKGLLSEDEVNVLRDYDSLIQEIIKVDEFTFDLNTVIT